MRGCAGTAGRCGGRLGAEGERVVVCMEFCGSPGGGGAVRPSWLGPWLWFPVGPVEGFGGLGSLAAGMLEGLWFLSGSRCRASDLEQHKEAVLTPGFRQGSALASLQPPVISSSSTRGSGLQLPRAAQSVSFLLCSRCDCVRGGFGREGQRAAAMGALPPGRPRGQHPHAQGSSHRPTSG